MIIPSTFVSEGIRIADFLEGFAVYRCKHKSGLGLAVFATGKDAALLDEILRKIERDRRAKERAATPANTSGDTSKGIANAKEKAKEKKPKPAQPDPCDRGPS